MFCNMFFSFFATLGPFGIIIVRHFPKKCDNAAMPRLVKTLQPKNKSKKIRYTKVGQENVKVCIYLWLPDTLYIDDLQRNSILC